MAPKKRPPQHASKSNDAPKQKPTKQDIASLPKKPPRAQDYYRNERYEKIKTDNPESDNSIVLRIAKRMWQSEPAEVRKKYMDMAKQEQEAYKQAHREFTHKFGELDKAKMPSESKKRKRVDDVELDEDTMRATKKAKTVHDLQVTVQTLNKALEDAKKELDRASKLQGMSENEITELKKSEKDKKKEKRKERKLARRAQREQKKKKKLNGKKKSSADGEEQKDEEMKDATTSESTITISVAEPAKKDEDVEMKEAAPVAKTPEKPKKTAVKKTPIKADTSDNATPQKPKKTPAKQAEQSNGDAEVAKTPKKSVAKPKQDAEVVATPQKSAPVVEQVATPLKQTPKKQQVKTPSKPQSEDVEMKEAAPVVKTPEKKTPVKKTPAKQTPVKAEQSAPVVEQQVATPLKQTPKKLKTPSKSQSEDVEMKEAAPVVKTPVKTEVVTSTPQKQTPKKTPAKQTPAKAEQNGDASTPQATKTPKKAEEKDAASSVKTPAKDAFAKPLTPKKAVADTPSKKPVAAPVDTPSKATSATPIRSRKNRQQANKPASQPSE